MNLPLSNSDEVNDLLTSDIVTENPRSPFLPYPRQIDRIERRARTRLVATTAVALLAFVGWAAATELDRVTHGEGRVVPQLQNQVVQHLEGGIISEILVREGERVERGQPLVRIENSFARSEYQQARIEVKAKRVRLARLEAESQGAETLAIPDDMAADVVSIAERERGLFDIRRQTLAVQNRIIEDQLRQKELEIGELKSRWALTRDERELVLKRLANLRRLAAIGAVSANDLIDNERQLQQIDTKISDLVHDIPRTEAAISELGGRRHEITLKFRSDADRERADTEVQIAKLEESMAALQDRKVRNEVVAPIAGVVNKLFFSTVGGVVKSGEPLVQLVPVDASIAVEARLLPADRAQVWPGLPAVVKVSAYDFSVHGGLPGKVVDISPDALQDEKGQTYFRVRLEADGTKFGPDRPVVPGMLAEVNIMSGRQTVMQALLRPVKRVQENALR